MNRNEITIDIPENAESSIFGEYDQFVKAIEKAFNITIILRN